MGMSSKFSLISVETQPMTRELAIRHMTLPSIKGERGISRTRMFHLKREIEAGNITAFRWVTAAILGTNSIYRVNGQHSSTLFAKQIAPSGVAILEHYVCESMDAAVSLWSRFDATFSARTRSEIIDATFSTSSDEALAKLPKNFCKLVTSAITIAIHGPGYDNKISHYEKSSAATEHRDFILWFYEILKPEACCNRIGVAVAAFFAYKHSPSMATNFFQEVQEGSNPDPCSATRVLRETLITHTVKTGKGARVGARMLTWDQFTELCLSAWHSWIENKKVKHLRLSKEGWTKFRMQQAKKQEEKEISDFLDDDASEKRYLKQTRDKSNAV